MASHPESLTRIPLIRSVIDDTHLRRGERGIDQRWYYDGLIPISVAGFNPFENRFFYSKTSRLAQWLKAPGSSARKFNYRDFLVREAFFMAHDYFHIWAVSAIRELAQKELTYGSDTVTTDNLETYAFCHILTEAVATVAVDYWYLSQIRINEICPIGTQLKGLTVSYHADDDSEYRRFDANLRVNSADFFKFLANFYCSGIFQGFSIGDLKRSPALFSWLDHEVTYGETQRKYARQWFSYLCKEKIDLSNEDLTRAIQVDQPWQKRLIGELGEALWEKLKKSSLPSKKPEFILNQFDTSALWKHSKKKAPDPRFLNLLRHDPKWFAKKMLGGAEVKERFKYFFYQYLSQYNWEKTDPQLKKLIPVLLEKMDFDLIDGLFKRQARIPMGKHEPEHLFILN